MKLLLMKKEKPMGSARKLVMPALMLVVLAAARIVGAAQAPPPRPTPTFTREMPPWYIDRSVGIKKFKNDPSPTDEEVDLIARWVDAGAPMGNPADMPPPRQFDDLDRWHIQ